ncbi:MAG: chloride channel protein [Flavobacteriales bacterium]|nr:MAG: chloride channel protein [Flavobacteriales bacterium]
MQKTKSIIKKINHWRLRYISQRKFIFISSALVGFLAGLAAVTLKNITFSIEKVFEQGIIFSNNQLYFILPVIGLSLVYLIKKYIFRKAMYPEFPPFIKRAIPSILYALLRQNGRISNRHIYYQLFTAPITVGFGGSVGLLGPAVTTGSAISSSLSRLFLIDKKTRTLLIACATSGVVASMFKAPIAALVFAIEIFSLDLAFASLVPLLLASIASVLTSYFFLGDEVLFSFDVTDKFILRDTIFYIMLGVSTGVASLYFTKIYFGIYKFFGRFKTRFVKLLVGGVIIGIMLYLIPPLYGEGLEFINNLLHENTRDALGVTPFDNFIDNIWVVIGLLIGITVFKAIAMTTTFAAGGVGGVVIPTLVMGSTLGNVFAKIINNIGLGFHISEANFTLIGMAGLIAGVIQAPLTAIFLIAEITGGYELFIPLMITVAISFMITKHYMEHTIYTRELAESGNLLTHDRDQNALLLMKINEVIENNFIPLKPEMTLGDLLHKGVAKSTRNIFPVINKHKNLVGIVLVDDIRDLMFNQELYDITKVQDYMHQPPEFIIYEKDSMQSVMEKFQKTGAWNLPVIKDNQYLGFISKSKLLTAYRNKLLQTTN